MFPDNKNTHIHIHVHIYTHTHAHTGVDQDSLQPQITMGMVLIFWGVSCFCWFSPLAIPCITDLFINTHMHLHRQTRLVVFPYAQSTHIYKHIYRYTHTQIYIYTHRYMQICRHTRTYVHIYTYTPIYTYIHIYTHTHIHTYTHTHVHVYTYTATEVQREKNLIFRLQAFSSFLLVLHLEFLGHPCCRCNYARGCRFRFLFFLAGGEGNTGTSVAFPSFVSFFVGGGGLKGKTGTCFFFVRGGVKR